MKDISIYFSSLETIENPVSESLGEFIVCHDGSGFPEIDRAGIALIYVPEFRNGEMSLHGQTDDRFRSHLSTYFPTSNWNFKIYDLGNLMPGERVEDTYFALRQVVAELVKKSVIPVVIGGSQDLTYAMYQGYEELEQLINVLNVDSRLDLGDPELSIGKDAYVSKLLMHRPCYLFNLSVIGYQTPLVKASEIDLFEKLFFDAIRLGEFKGDFRVAEPLLRNTDLLSIDLQSIKASDFKGKYFSQPNGFDNMDICQIAKYAGISDKLTSVGLFNLLPGDIAESAHAEIAQIIWYFIDGYSQRVGDFPIGSKKDYTKFTVFLDEINHDIIFYRSNRSERWWMEVPYPPKEGIKYERHHMVPCDKSQYNNALNGDIPNLWWKTYQKLG